MDVQALRVALYTNGFAIVPVCTNDKKPFGSDWPRRARTLTSAIASVWPDAAALSTGVLSDGLVPIDVDVDDAALAERIVALALTTLGAAPIRFRANSPRCLLLYRSSEERIRSANVSDGSGRKLIEVLGQGRQFVAYGVHPSGSRYEWKGGELSKTLRASLTRVSPDQMDAFMDAVANESQGNASHTRVKDLETLTVRNASIGQRERAYAREALEGECAKLVRMGEGSHRNVALNSAAHSLGTMTVLNWIDAKSVAHALLEAAVKNGYVSKRGIKAAQDTIKSGLNAGALKPRAPLAEDDGDLMDLSALEAGDSGVRRMLSTLQQARAPRVSALKVPIEAKVATRRSVILTGLASVQEVPIQWHWPGYLPAGMLTLLSGASGTGKSTLAFGFAATITTGGLWPDGKRCARAGNVLIWSSEDDVARTIKPRLMAAGADISRVGVIEGTTDSDGSRLPFDPARDMDNLRTAVRAIGGIALLIIDPIVSAVSGDMHKANDVRRSLQPIVDFAAEFGCAVLGITHFAKNTGGRNASERVIGSQAFAALARMVLVTAKEEDSDRRVFTRAKSNISADDGGYYYEVEEVALPNSLIRATRTIWGEAIQGNARSILAIVENNETEHYGRKIDEASNFLHKTLANGPLPVTQVKALARSAGITSVTLQRAKDATNVQSVKSKGEFTGGWDWMLPIQQRTPMPEGLLG